MLKFSKKNIIIILIVAFLISVMSNLYDYVNEALDYKNTKETKARENLNSLIKWSENEGKEELKYAKNLSKETYNQEKVTKEIIKNFEKIKTSIEDIKTLSTYNTTKEDKELIKKVTKIITSLIVEGILPKLLINEANIRRQENLFLFDKERFQALEEFLIHLNTYLEEDFLKNSQNFEIFYIAYIGLLAIVSKSYYIYYIYDIENNFSCGFNNFKTKSILSNVNIINTKVFDKIINILEEKYVPNNKDISYQNGIDFIRKQKIDNKIINKLQTLQTKLKECEK
ncbi:hypothetical protein B6S12_10295 [Helicobacter valdiviensis]|uniref:Uncharacterized protein n=1 Tax=Helicobacter valdiviensis TaxID=1458358 RepID=A0A2W6MTH0_9HELI|nr:hypothetical protein [Helicobacter valdiviensis]PZT47209.1 hypothetical protein B6S12_10295 [Helicobacter valdiviensis]